MNAEFKKFFEALPARLKVVMHALEMLFSLYMTTTLMVYNGPLGKYLEPMLPYVAVGFTALYPPIRLIVQLTVGVPGTDARKGPGL